MAFGALRRVFGGKGDRSEAAAAAPAPGRKSLAPADLAGWLGSELSRELGRERKELFSISSDLLRGMKDLQKNVQNIRQKSFEAGDKTYAAVNMIKDTWAKRALMGFASYNRGAGRDMASPDKLDFRSFRELHRDTFRLLGEISMIPRQKIVLGRYFEAESRKMGDILQSVGGLMEKMKARIDGDGVLKGMSRLEELVGELSALERELSARGKAMEDTDSLISQKREEIGEAGRKAASMRKSPEWKDMEDAGRRMEESSGRKTEIEDEISGALGPMKRMFKLFAHDAEGLDKREVRLVEGLSRSPLKTFLSSEDGLTAKVLEKMREDIGGGSFRVSEKDRGRAEQLNRLLDTGLLARARSDYEKVMKDIADAGRRKEQIRVAAELGEQERLLEKAKAELAMAEREREKLGRSLRETKEALGGKRKEISGFVRKELGREIELL